MTPYNIKAMGDTRGNNQHGGYPKNSHTKKIRKENKYGETKNPKYPLIRYCKKTKNTTTGRTNQININIRTTHMERNPTEKKQDQVAFGRIRLMMGKQLITRTQKSTQYKTYIELKQPAIQSWLQKWK